MSIFESKEFWTTKIGNNEEFDNNSIVIGNLDNEKPAKTKIAVSSFQGFLRVYEPFFGDFRQENRLLEKNYKESILQIGLGSMIINSPDQQLVVLTKNKVQVLQLYSLRSVPNTKVCIEHRLQCRCYNFCLGKIGDKNYDIVFVQSVDGLITIIEQDSIVNIVELPDMLMPGCIVYVDRKDNFVITTPSYEVQCYTYNNLATLKTEKQSSTNNTGLSKQGKIIQNWIFNIGELVKEMKTINNVLTKKQEIFILSETMIYVLSDTGSVIYQKKLDYETITSYIYNIDDSGYQLNKQINFMQLISTINNHIMVYKGNTLAWALK